MVRVCESNIILPSVLRRAVRPSVRHVNFSSLLLNHWAEFNQTCYTTFPHGKGVREQIFFLCVRPCIRLVHFSMLTLCHGGHLAVRTLISSLSSPNHWAEFNQTCYTTFLRGKGVRESNVIFLCVRPCVRLVHLSVTLTFPKPQGGI